MKKTLFVPSGHCAKKKKSFRVRVKSNLCAPFVGVISLHAKSNVCKKGGGMLSELAIVETAKTKGMVTVGLK